VSELARRILRRSLDSVRDQWLHCSKCRRTPVPGEFVHRLSSERIVCSLCFAKVSASRRDGATAERVHAGERHVSAARRAA
jgi:hypothetical protein